jgi:ornithine cyclodeaminase
MISLTHAFPSITLTFGVNDPSASASASQADVEHAVDMPNLLGQADIIITCTPSTEPLFDGNLVKAGAHLALIGSYKPHMREVDDRLIERAGVVLVDSKEACGTEAGELIRANVTDEGMVELGQTLVDKEQVGRVVSGGDVTLFKSVSGTCSKRKVEEVSEREELMRQVGIGIQDVAVAALVLEQAQAAGLGTTIPDYDFAG